MTLPETSSASACEALVRDHDRDRWLAGLLAPAAHRPGLLALAAFDIELARVRDAVSSPLPGEIRLQWWRDALEPAGRAGAAGNPVAEALLAAIARYNLPRAALLAMIEARTQDLYDDLPPTLADLEGYCGETVSALLRLSALVLADGGDPGPADAAGHGGVALGLLALLKALPRHAARGQGLVPRDILDKHGADLADILSGRATAGVKAALADLRAETRRHLALARESLRSAPRTVLPAFRTLALVEPTLRLMDRPSYDPFRDAVDLPQWRRQWLLWRAA